MRGRPLRSYFSVAGVAILLLVLCLVRVLMGVLGMSADGNARKRPFLSVVEDGHLLPAGD